MVYERKTLGIVLVVIALILVVGLVVFLLMWDTSKTNGRDSGANDDTNGNFDETGETNQPKTYNARVEDFAFSPSTLTIKEGDTITWTNLDSVSHTVTSDSGEELDSQLLSKDQTYSHTFDTRGTFSYHCTPHPNMKARIIVE